MDPFQKRKLNVVLQRLYAMGAPKAGDLHVGRAMASALFVQFNVEYSCVSNLFHNHSEYISRSRGFLSNYLHTQVIQMSWTN